LAVSRTVVAVDYQIHESTGKTRSSRRSIDLDDRTIEVLGQWRKRQRRELGKYDPNSPLFTRTDGNVIHPHSLSQAFERAVAKTTLPRISLHDLRHTHATLLIKAGVPLKVVSERLGHSSPAFTMATYQHILPGMQADDAATFAALLESHVLPGSTR
jgi:integrase